MKAPWVGFRSIHETACFLPAIPVIMMAVTAASAAASGAAMISSGMAQAAAGKYDAQVDKNNAIQATQATDQQSVISQEQTNAKLGQQAVAYGASGVQTGTGSALNVMTQTATQGKLDAMTLRYGGAVQAANDMAGGTIAQYMGNQAQASSFAQAGGTILTGIGSTVKASGWTPGSGGSGGQSSNSGTQTAAPPTQGPTW